MPLPFTDLEFKEVFLRYNEGIWPAQVLLIAIGLAAFPAMLPSKRSVWKRVAAAALAVLWFWAGAVYHWGYFASINPLARLFAVLFVGTGAMFAWHVRRPLPFGGAGTVRVVTGHVLFVYALALYPLLSMLLGHRFPAAPTFGAPCPLTIMTIGLLLTMKPVPLHLGIVPLLWAVIATSAALNLRMYEDFGLTIAGVCLVIMMIMERMSTRAVAAADCR